MPGAMEVFDVTDSSALLRMQLKVDKRCPLMEYTVTLTGVSG